MWQQNHQKPLLESSREENRIWRITKEKEELEDEIRFFERWQLEVDQQLKKKLSRAKKLADSLLYIK